MNDPGSASHSAVSASLSPSATVADSDTAAKPGLPSAPAGSAHVVALLTSVTTGAALHVTLTGTATVAAEQ